MGDLFQPISEDEWKAETAKGVEEAKPTRARAKRKPVTEPRINTVWFTLPTSFGFCTCEQHEEIQRMLNPEAKEYRQKYPTRSVFEIQEGLFICRDCFIHEGDKP